jgi:hypothetical protein
MELWSFFWEYQLCSLEFDSTVETGNDLYKTVVRLQLILFSKDIGAF